MNFRQCVLMTTLSAVTQDVEFHEYNCTDHLLAFLYMLCKTATYNISQNLASKVVKQNYDVVNKRSVCIVS